MFGLQTDIPVAVYNYTDVTISGGEPEHCYSRCAWHNNYRLYFKFVWGCLGRLTVDLLVVHICA